MEALAEIALKIIYNSLFDSSVLWTCWILITSMDKLVYSTDH